MQHAESLCSAVVLGAALLLAGRGMRQAWAEPPGPPLKQAANAAATSRAVPQPAVDGTCVKGGRVMTTTSATSCERAGGHFSDAAGAGATGARGTPSDVTAGTSSGAHGG